MRDLGGRDQRAERGDQRPERAREPAAVEPLADDHPAAVKAVLAAARLHGGGDRLAHLAVLGRDHRLEPEQAAVLGALGGVHLRPVERRDQPALGQSPALLAHELVLVPAVQAARELLEVRRGRGQLEAHDRRRAGGDLRAGDLLERRGRLLLAVGDQRVHEAALLAKPHHVPRLAQRARARAGLLAVRAAEPDVRVGGADRPVERGDRSGLAADVDRPLQLIVAGRPGRPAADQLQRHIRLPVAQAVGRPRADDVRDRLDHVLEVLALGLIVGREVKLIQRVFAAAASPQAPQREHDQQQAEQQQARGDLKPGHHQRAQAAAGMPARGGRPVGGGPAGGGVRRRRPTPGGVAWPAPLACGGRPRSRSSGRRRRRRRRELKERGAVQRSHLL